MRKSHLSHSLGANCSHSERKRGRGETIGGLWLCHLPPLLLAEDLGEKVRYELAPTVGNFCRPSSGCGLMLWKTGKSFPEMTPLTFLPILGPAQDSESWFFTLGGIFVSGPQHR